MYFSVAMIRNYFLSNINIFVYRFVLVTEQNGAHLEDTPIYFIVLIKPVLFRSE